MGVLNAAFREGDIYIDYAYESVMFRYIQNTGKVFRRFYSDAEEAEIPHSSNLFNEALLAGKLITAEQYYSALEEAVATDGITRLLQVSK